MSAALRWDAEGRPWANEAVSLGFWILLPILYGSAVRARRAHLFATHPVQAGEILTELTGTTTAALRGLEATVGLLRRPETAEESLHPAPGLERLPDLVAAFAAAALDITVAVDGPVKPLAAGVDLTAFRILTTRPRAVRQPHPARA